MGVPQLWMVTIGDDNHRFLPGVGVCVCVLFLRARDGTPLQIGPPKHPGSTVGQGA